jgi:hypothetical protein
LRRPIMLRFVTMFTPRITESGFDSVRRSPMCRRRSFQATRRGALAFAQCHGRARLSPHPRSR